MLSHLQLGNRRSYGHVEARKHGYVLTQTYRAKWQFVHSVYKRDNIEGSLLEMTESGEDVVQAVDAEADTIESSQLRMTESGKDVVQSVDEAVTIDSSQLRMTESGKDVGQSLDEADKDPSENSLTDLQSISSSKTEFEGRSTHIPSIEAQPILTEEDNRLQAAFNILYTVPRAIEDFIDREYKGGFLQSIRDHKDQLKATLNSEEWELLSQLIGTVMTDLTQTHSKMKNCHKVQKKTRIGET
ncbi:unnamed protein product [Mytilus coruscus]|uniref:Uncharacterized protein n=1 Tax=Mytilus coruscus TaxID=42192 RepID=A0A6J8ERK7_MYTCO|nr:unnamed protein product [Mytilus coruscus]